MRLVAGTRTLSKYTSLVWWISSRVIMGRMLIPGVSVSISNSEMPACLRALGSVRTRQNILLATCA